MTAPMPDPETTKAGGQAVNEYGSPVSVRCCFVCGARFTVCPPAENEEDWQGCMAPNCASYDPERDADRLFEDEPHRISREARPDA